MHCTPVAHFLYQMVLATLRKVRELKASWLDRPVILMGWGVRDAKASHVAGIDKLAVLVCLGLPMATLAGSRGQVGDPLLEIETRVIFVIGEKTTQSSCELMLKTLERVSVWKLAW